MKTRRMFLRLAFSAIAVAALTAAPAVAQPGPMGPGPHGGGMHGQGEFLAHMLHRLDLSDAQRDQIHQIMDRTRQETESNRDTMRSAHDTLAELMHAEVFDEASIRAAAEQVAAAQAEMIVAHARALRDVRQLLTPEQLVPFQQMLERRQEHRDEMGDMGRGRGYRHGRHGHGKAWESDQDPGGSEE